MSKPVFLYIIVIFSPITLLFIKINIIFLISKRGLVPSALLIVLYC